MMLCTMLFVLVIALVMVWGDDGGIAEWYLVSVQGFSASSGSSGFASLVAALASRDGSAIVEYYSASEALVFSTLNSLIATGATQDDISPFDAAAKLVGIWQSHDAASDDAAAAEAAAAAGNYQSWIVSIARSNTVSQSFANTLASLGGHLITPTELALEPGIEKLLIKLPGFNASAIAMGIAKRTDVLSVERRHPLELHNKWARDVVCRAADTAEVYVADQSENSCASQSTWGSEVVVGLVDTGIDMSSCYFYDANVPNIPYRESSYHRRVKYYYDYVDGRDDEWTGHGTHVAGTLAGHINDSSAGANSGYSEFNGLSEARLAFYDIGDSDGQLSIPADLTDVFYPLYQQGARVISNSWGSMTNSYTSDSQAVDKFMSRYPDALIIFSAGNSGENGAYSVTAPSTNKNGIAVGASLSSSTSFSNLYKAESKLGASSMASFSSMGPTHDGRVKPDLAAPGFWIVSAGVASSSSASAGSSQSGDAECHSILRVLRGTSMAAPVVAAAAVKIREGFLKGAFNQRPMNPSGALVKAMLIQSTMRLSTVVDDYFTTTELSSDKWPDTRQGYGTIRLEGVMGDPNIFAIGSASDEGDGLYRAVGVNGDVVSFAFQAVRSRPIRITLSYTDVITTSSSSTQVVVNKLALKLIDTCSDVVYVAAGWSADTPADTVQSIALQTSQKGCGYSVLVEGEDVYDTQPFALVVQGFGNSSLVTSSLTNSINTHSIFRDIMDSAERGFTQFAAMNTDQQFTHVMYGICILAILIWLFNFLVACMRSCIGYVKGGRPGFHAAAERHCLRWPWVGGPMQRPRRQPAPTGERVWVLPAPLSPCDTHTMERPPAHAPPPSPPIGYFYANHPYAQPDTQDEAEASSPMHYYSTPSPSAPTVAHPPLVQAVVVEETRSVPRRPFYLEEDVGTHSPLHHTNQHRR